ncbi:MAG: translocation/assembly module TamB domain-containing protein [Burkholderiales bacterium]
MARVRAAWIALLVLIVSILGAVAGGAWIFYSTSGLQWLAARGIGYSGERLEIRGVSGTLAGGAHAGAIEFTTDDLSVRVQQAHFTLSPWSLLRLSADVENLAAARIEIKTKPSDDPPSPLPDSIALPIDVSIRNARIGVLAFDNAIRVFELHKVHLEYAGGQRRHDVKELDFSVSGQAIALRGTIEARKPFELKAHLAFVRPAEPSATVGASVTGNLSRLQIEAHARSQGASANATATLRPDEPQPLDALKVAIRDLDPRAIDARLPHAGISAEIALARKGARLEGPVWVRNAVPGPIDHERVPLASLQAHVLTDLSTLAFSRLHVDLGAAGVVTGSGNVEGKEATLELVTKGLNLRAVHSALRETRLAGGATLELGPSAQSVVAELSQDDVRLAFAADRASNEIDISRFDAEATGGSAKGRAHINLSGQTPFTAQVQLNRFDPSAWGDFPQGSINASLRAEGVAQEPAGRVEFALHDSRWLGAPLAGKGTIEASTERVAQADVELELGANRLAAKGAFGGKDDSLAVKFDAPQLDLIGGEVRGQARGTAVVSGTFQAPSIELDASAAQLMYSAYGSIDALQVRGHTSLAPDAPMELRATLTGVTTPQVALRTVRLNVDGRRSRHEAVLEAAGEPIDLRLRLRGGLSEENRWAGTVLELANRGEIPIELARPVALRIARALVQVEPFELRIAGGLLVVEALDYDNEHLRTAGNFRAMPVARLIGLIDRQAPVKGSLSLSGHWDVATSPQLRGAISIARESGDLLVGAKEPFDLGLSALAASADIDPGRIEFRANVELALARAAASGRIGAVDGGQAIPYTAASPLDFTASVDVARLAPFADFIDTAMILHGEAHARLQGGGTLGDPQMTGQVDATDMGILMPADGVSLRDGTLKAVITPQDIRIESFSIRGGDGVLTAQGTLARAGFDRASVDWRAESFTALGRPDRKLVVSGQGNAALQDKRLAMSGMLRVVEGEFDIGESALPTLSSDVVVVGREPLTKERQQRTFQNLALDLRLDLGNRMHISGHGLNARLSGELRLVTDKAGQLRASGTIHTRDGTFVAYGQRLVIDRGNLYFNGPLDNPGLDIVAMRKRQAVEAGVALTGTLQTPLVRVVSDPPVPEGEALSWLVLGRSPNEAGTGELSALPLASNLLLGKAANPLKDALKLDELGLRGGGAGEQFLTLGKRLTDRLYLVFEQGFGSAETLLRLEYSLTRRVVLRLQAGEASGGGVFYRRRWN